MAGGYTMMLPKEEKIAVMTKDELLAQITGLLGGRVSEEMFLHEISTGASDDFKKATRIARSMVTEYGMSDLGPVQYEEKSENVFLGRDYAKSRDFSDQVALEIDEQVRKIIEDCYEKAKKIIGENKDLIFALSDALMQYETITKEQIESIVETGKIKPIEEIKEEKQTEVKEEPKKKVKKNNEENSSIAVLSKDVSSQRGNLIFGSKLISAPRFFASSIAFLCACFMGKSPRDTEQKCSAKQSLNMSSLRFKAS